MLFHKKNNKFTLVEIMIAAGVMSLVLASLMSVYLFAARMYHENSAVLYLDQQFRLAREKILGSIEGQYGIMEANQNSIRIFPGNSDQVDRIDFTVDGNDIVTPDTRNDDIQCRIMRNPGLGLTARTVPVNGRPKRMLDGNVQVQSMNINRNGDIITFNLTLSTTVGGESFSRSQNIRVNLTNE